MSIRKLNEKVAVSPQLTVADIEAAAAQGYKTVINNRPDQEGPGQPSSDDLKAVAEKHGMNYYHIPVVPGQISDQQVEEFGKAVEGCSGPVLAFCKSGTRAACLWALSEAANEDPDAILSACNSAGYDLSGLAPRIRACSGPECKD
ncbi:TIGR01244 family sulfur transferase [Emcibacter sp.]|uniref:TIGR01244 family sulfur transferase n=1 Tax=Emcibacter sp. TaxID=1979954 RepID=UPI002AA677BA|nr:TIGR01244 family sulfur transferase [Emcibacter sp.]